MVNEVATGDAVHPLAHAGIELPKPKESIVADTEGIKGVDPAQQPARSFAASNYRRSSLLLRFSRGVRIPSRHLVSAFLICAGDSKKLATDLFSREFLLRLAIFIIVSAASNAM